MPGPFIKRYAALPLLAAFTLVTHAQSLPPPAKTVFKCEENGKVVYSDSPCLGAKTVDVEPPRGVNRLSGQERVGSGADSLGFLLADGLAACCFRPEVK